MTTRYLDLVNGNDSNNGSSFALRKKTLLSATSGLTGGDTVRVMQSPDPTSLGQNATFTNGSDTITLTTAVTANIDTCESAWTASANVTATAQSTTQREGTNAASLAIASAFTTGLVAYHAMSSTDFSAYKQISFVMRTNAALSAGVLTLSLCSDAAGVTAVNTISIPALASGLWTAVTVDTGGALGSAIQSVALNALSDPGTITVFLDNIIACKDSTAADSLTHISLISKNTGTEPWMAIDTINGTTIKLGGGYHHLANRSTPQPYYYGTTATQTIYKRDVINLTSTQTASGSASGVLIEGGWDTSAMSSQSGKTFTRIQNPDFNSSQVDLSSCIAESINNWYVVNSNGTGFNFGQSPIVGEVGAIACFRGFSIPQSMDVKAQSNATRYTMHCGNAVRFTGSPLAAGDDVRLRFNYMWGYLSSDSTIMAILDAGSGGVMQPLHVYNCDIQGHYTPVAINAGNSGTFTEAIFQGCTIKNINREFSSSYNKISYINCTNSNITTANTVSGLGVIYFTNIANDTTNHKILFGQYKGLGSIISDTSTRHTASDFSWKFVNTTSGSSTNTSRLSIAKIACVANEQRTVKLWMYRSSTSLTMRMKVKGGMVAGIDDDITAAMTAAINTWEQITLQFTPTQQCVVEVFVEAYGAAANGWIDDLSVT